jgi:hypothetical protein
MLIKTKIIFVLCSLCLIIATVFVLFGRRSSLAEPSLPIVVTDIQTNQTLPADEVTKTDTANLQSKSSDNESSIDAKFASAAARNSQLKLNLK